MNLVRESIHPVLKPKSVKPEEMIKEISQEAFTKFGRDQLLELVPEIIGADIEDDGSISCSLYGMISIIGKIAETLGGEFKSIWKATNGRLNWEDLIFDEFIKSYNIKWERIVQESLSDVLRPKTDEDIIKDMRPLVDDFVDSITPEQIEELIDDINEWKPGLFRKFAEGDRVSYMTNEEGVYDLVDDVAFKISTGKDPVTDDYYFPNQEFQDFWSKFQTSDKANYDSIMKMMDYILQKFATKFNIEY